MKPLLSSSFLLGLIFCCFSAQAQEKGSLQLGFRQLPGFGFTGDDSWRMSITPNVGYYLSDRWVVGLSPLFSYSQSKQEDVLDRKDLNLGLEVYSRYYFLNGRFRIFGEVSTGLSRRTEWVDNSVNGRSIKRTYSPQAFALGSIGASYKLGKRVALELTVPLMNLQVNQANTSFEFKPQTPRLGLQFFLR